ncbi:unnamed protein product [Bubo scandiacus]
MPGPDTFLSSFPSPFPPLWKAESQPLHFATATKSHFAIPVYFIRLLFVFGIRRTPSTSSSKHFAFLLPRKTQPAAPAALGHRFWLTGAPATLTAVALAAQETNRPPFGARRSRKLARLQVENLPRQCFESNMPHLPAGELEIAIPDLCSRRLLMPNLRTLCSLLPYKEQMKWGLKAREIRSRTELSKRMRLYSRKGNYKKVHVHGYHPHDRQRPMEKPNNS